MVRHKTRRAILEVSQRISCIANALNIESIIVSEALEHLAETIAHFQYVFYLEFAFALLYYFSRFHHQRPLRVLISRWHIYQIQRLSDDQLTTSEKEVLRKYYRPLRYRIMLRIYRRLVTILGRPPPFNLSEYCLENLEEVSGNLHLSIKTKDKTKELIENFPPGNYTRDPRIILAAYIYVACKMEEEKQSLYRITDTTGSPNYVYVWFLASKLEQELLS